MTHDVLVTLELFSIFDRVIDLTSIAGFLNIIGCSLNDTIAVCDRTREKRDTCPKENCSSAVNPGINETLSQPF